LTEVPEHLLKRSKDRRGAMGLGGGDAAPAEAGAAVESSAASTPATTSAAPAAATPAAAPVAKVPEPVAPYVQAALDRKKIPVWALPVVALLPVWAFLYVSTLSPPVSDEPTQLAAGAEIYGLCASCHGGAGGGGAGRVLNNGEVVATFPDIESMIEFVWVGSDGIGPAGTPYGDPAREGGAHSTRSYNGSPMPAFASLSQTELLEVVRHERETLSGEQVPAEQIGPDGELLHPNGTPYLNQAGELVNEDGEPMFDEGGRLTGAMGTGSGSAEVAAP